MDHKKITFGPLFAITVIIAAAISACDAQESPLRPSEQDKSPNHETNNIPNPTTPSGSNGNNKAIVSTRQGNLLLSYADGKATLSGTLQRSTPCVDWKITSRISEGFPEQVVFDIEDASTAEMCIQVLGEPQNVSAAAQASANARYTVYFKGEDVFEGTLS